MKIIICGSGPVGIGIARQLANEGNDITIVDNNPQQIKEINESLDVHAFVGFPSHPTVLDQAGAKRAEMIIAVTSSDETNMVVSQVAHSIFQVPIKIARIRHKNYLMPEWSDLYRKEHLPIDHIISPELEVADAIINRLQVPGAIDSIPFMNDAMRVVEVPVPEDCSLVNLPIAHVEEMAMELNMGILSIMRDHSIVLYNKKVKLQEGDAVYFAAPTKNISKIMTLFGIDERQARRILIVGGGNVGYFIAQELEKRPGVNTKIIELNEARAEYLADRLKDTTVICGNALDQDILQESNSDSTETVIAVSNSDQVNILTSILAKRQGAKRSIALLAQQGFYVDFADSLGVDVTVNPREMTVSSVLRYTRKGKIRSAYSVCEGAAEMVQIEITSSALIANRRISELGLPNGVRIGAIIRGEEVIIPTSKTKTRPHDQVVIFSPTEEIQKVDHIFSAQQDYF